MHTTNAYVIHCFFYLLMHLLINLFTIKYFCVQIVIIILIKMVNYFMYIIYWKNI